MPRPKPKVRIGMIQAAEEIRFRCDKPFRLMTLDGQEQGTGRADVEYRVEKIESTPAHIRWAVRLAIRETEEEARQFQAEEKLQTKLWRQGLTLPLNHQLIDNREYWIVTGPFATHDQAQDFCRSYEPAGEAVVVKEIVSPAAGVLRCGDQRFVAGLRIEPQDPTAILSLADVTVGIEFHWQHKRTQQLPGCLEIRFNTSGALLAINELDIESYLVSVNSSEMTAENPMELLKAQTVAARSTILATMGKHHYDEPFHLCSDDHCQCYHGIANVSSASQQAAAATEGETLLFNNRVCDARYAKICGGVMEDYEHVWDQRRIPYLVSGVDGEAPIAADLREESDAKAYIDSTPDVYCNTLKYKISSSLPYNTRELFRWRVTFTREQLEALIKSKLGEDFGKLVDLEPGERGRSGRLKWLDVIGSHKTIRVGKELAIRRILSESHLYSACFYIERDRAESGTVLRFHLIGAGWGHGVGLCQVGATVMAQQGFTYRRILQHYYRNSTLQKLY
ncbi:MAG TPA: SpoIID/LytB domain-containing protein [bacterium]|nr:SpoIID/LytB domain-containing protein [bacterium]